MQIVCVLTYRESLLHSLPKLLRHSIAGVVDLKIASLAGNLLGGVWSTRKPPSRICPPLLQLLHLVLESLLFRVYAVRHLARLDVVGEDGRDSVDNLLQSFCQLD